MKTQNGKTGRQTRRPTPGSDGNEKSPAADTAMTQRALHDMIVRQGFKCAMTGWDLSPKTASVDHIIPLSKGGEHSISNAHIVHTTVNRAKSVLSLEEFVEMCCAVADWSRKNKRPAKTKQKESAI